MQTLNIKSAKILHNPDGIFWGEPLIDLWVEIDNPSSEEVRKVMDLFETREKTKINQEVGFYTPISFELSSLPDRVLAGFKKYNA